MDDGKAPVVPLTPGEGPVPPPEPEPDASWRPTDWVVGAQRRSYSRTHAKKNGLPAPTEDPENYVSPTEAQQEEASGVAEGEVLPTYQQFGSYGEPWHQQPGETHEAYRAFWTYVKMGPTRTLIRVCHRLRHTKTTVTCWSKQHHWRMRLFRFLSEEDRVKQQNYRHQLADMAERHAKFARAMSGKIIQRLQSMDISELTPRDMAVWYKTTTDLERQALDADRLRRPEMTTRSMRREDALARNWARGTGHHDPRYDNDDDGL